MKTTLITILSIFMFSCTQSKTKESKNEVTDTVEQTELSIEYDENLDVTQLQNELPTDSITGSLFPEFGFCVLDKYIIVDTSIEKYTPKGTYSTLYNHTIIVDIDESSLSDKLRSYIGKEFTVTGDSGNHVVTLTAYKLVATCFSEWDMIEIPEDSTKLDSALEAQFSMQSLSQMLVAEYDTVLYERDGIFATIGTSNPAYFNLFESDRVKSLVKNEITQTEEYEAINEGYLEFIETADEMYAREDDWWNAADVYVTQAKMEDKMYVLCQALTSSSCGDEFYDAQIGDMFLYNLDAQTFKPISFPNIFSADYWGLLKSASDYDNDGYPEFIIHMSNDDTILVKLLPDGTFIQIGFTIPMYFCPC